MNASQRANFSNILSDAAEKIGITLNEEQNGLLLDYLELLIKWNKAYNLTAIRDPEEMLIKHLVDSLSIAPYIKGQDIADIGTGPGLPGIPMAILFPEKRFLLVDSNGKKTRFLTQSKITLSLANIEIVHGRVESVAQDKQFDQIMSRAFTALDNMVKLCKHLLTEKGEFLAMKGLHPKDEINALPIDYHVKNAIKLCVPACEEDRHLIIIEKTSA
ncbi:16S rRNA methyltransferase G [Oleiphilus sp. HI0081]|nr:16S rRNA methyltransferase G [Oleiphilus sp. HI0043]KZY43267.1 16S rRNA methyltransferase G [Oleiphilus sp. HI0050]KZY58719.1 16S rRNA methyltransferase G [Oleiphilus sp. HI0061]KZY84260.1 16S rRNA methyltransferase G [Oleiphilus sp. HI0068]KZY87316.1 16S rRNA methyltransferase G [Oleiphilus sp. HI0069]KZY95456.1 16S rRNA methyltransferase G [Oleiphilus sp. HI0072]KZZ19488.1 16S rRNA methyltransferase G [Oleiphilus sp. HI0081]KZZ19646.1 16S rRNA methyltransferase G [Oleiphilus sp. HI0078]